MIDGMGTSGRLEIFTRQSDVADLSEPGEVRLGGITLYGASPNALADAVRRLEADVEDIVRHVASADKGSIASLLRMRGLDRRIVAAIIGSVLRQGRMAGFSGEDETGELVLIVCAAERQADFDARVWALEQRLRTDGPTGIKNLRKMFFPDEGRGTWTWTWHLAARATYRGGVCFIDRYHVASVGELDDVVGATG